MAQRSVSELQAIRAGVARIGRLSDSVVKIGPLSLGLDGVLAWAPGIGELYSAAAGAYILVQGVRAGVPVSVLTTCAALLFGRTALTAIPLAGPLAADFLTAHKWSSRLVIAAIDRKIAAAGAPASRTRRWAWRRPPQAVEALG